MGLVRAAIKGNLREAMEGEIRDAARAMRRGVERAGRDVQAMAREQARSGGFRDGGRAIANSWRLDVYPKGSVPRTLRPAALVWTKAPKLVEAFDKPATIRAKGQKFLAFPTGYNAARGRRGASGRGGVRVTPEQMRASRGEAFVIRSKSNPAVLLWCLRVRQASGLSRRARRLRLFAGANNAEVVTGRRRGQQALAREIADRGFVPMFFLMKQVTLKKRLSLADLRARASSILGAAIAAEMGRS